MFRMLAAASSAALGLALAVPASAQSAETPDGDKYNMVIVYGDQPCQPSQDPDMITVCARVDDQFRIPEPLRGSPSPSDESWTDKVTAYETVGAFGPLSCSPVGAGGSLGCTQQLIDAAYKERAEGSSVRFGELIAEARAERLSTIDAEAAETQARVEAAEQAYFEQQARQAAEQDAANRAAAETGDQP